MRGMNEQGVQGRAGGRNNQGMALNRGVWMETQAMAASQEGGSMV